MNITACRLQLAEESNLTVFPVKLQLMTEEGNDVWCELSGSSRNGDSKMGIPQFSIFLAVQISFIGWLL